MWPLVQSYHAKVRPLLPAELMRHVVGHDNHDEFMRSGWEVATMLNLAAMKYSGRFIYECGDTLDFGCGCGRIAQFLPPTQKLRGCDVGKAVIEECQVALPHFAFHQSPLLPPLQFDSGSFDLIYSFSVFSHLRKDVEEAWLEELRRVGRPHCLYLLTVHGDWWIEATLLTEERNMVQERGFFFREVHSRQGAAGEFPDYYECSYHTSRYIQAAWSDFFEIVAIVKGDDATRYNTERMVAPLIRPMGQDLVVARKR